MLTKSQIEDMGFELGEAQLTIAKRHASSFLALAQLVAQTADAMKLKGEKREAFSSAMLRAYYLGEAHALWRAEPAGAA